MKAASFTIRPSKKNPELLGQLEQLAIRSNTSINRYIVRVLLDHVMEERMKNSVFR